MDGLLFFNHVFFNEFESESEEEDLKNLENEFNRTKQSDSSENKFIGQQISSLTKDKTKLIESYNIADGRLRVCEKEIGTSDGY